jgi:hypothetical protein
MSRWLCIRLHGNQQSNASVACLLAVTGVPKANDLHAVVMCRFARSAMVKFRDVCRILELTLGPDTGGKLHRAFAKHMQPQGRSDAIVIQISPYELECTADL